MAYEELFTDLLKAEREEDVAVEPIELEFSVPTFTKNVKVGQPPATDEHAKESSQPPTRETATGGASRAVLEYGWASPLGIRL